MPDIASKLCYAWISSLLVNDDKDYCLRSRIAKIQIAQLNGGYQNTCWELLAGQTLGLPVFGNIPYRKYTTYHPSFMLLTSTAIFHLDTCVIQLAMLTLLACLPLVFWCWRCTVATSNGLLDSSAGGFQLRSALIGLIWNEPGPFQRVCSSCHINLLVNWCWTLYQ